MPIFYRITVFKNKDNDKSNQIKLLIVDEKPISKAI